MTTPRRTLRVGLSACVLLGAALVQARAHCAPAACSGAVCIDSRGERLSLSADAARLDTVLGALGEHLGIVVLVDAPLAEAVSLELRDRTIDEVLERLLRNHSYVLSYRRAWTGRIDESPNRLRVFTRPFAVAADASIPSQRPASRNEALVMVDFVEAVDQVVEMHRGDAASLVGELAAILAGSASTAMREEAVYALGRIRTPHSRDALTQALADPAETVREAAVYAIAEGGGPQASSLIAIALTDASSTVRDAARDSLELMR